MPKRILRGRVNKVVRGGSNSLLSRFGYQLIRDPFAGLPPAHHRIFESVKSRTMTGPYRIYSLISAVEYIEKNGIAGAIVECGVWRGGSMMAAAMTLRQHGDTSRELYLYDTFAGMTEPSELDVGFDGISARTAFEKMGGSENGSGWCFATLEDVEAGMATTNYPASKMVFVKGKVQDTIPQTLPSSIAILRLDTDWYDSTLHELRHLYPLLQPGGILIIDDYGHWQGSRKAVDEYLAEYEIPIYLHQVDFAARLGVKPR